MKCSAVMVGCREPAAFRHIYGVPPASSLPTPSEVFCDAHSLEVLGWDLDEVREGGNVPDLLAVELVEDWPS